MRPKHNFSMESLGEIKYPQFRKEINDHLPDKLGGPQMMKIQGGINVTGDGNIVSIASRLESVKVTINKSNHETPELQNLLNTLASQIESVSNANTGAEIELTDNLERLVGETQKASPNQKWYELSIEGLKEAATAIGDIGKPILGTISALKTLLLL